MSCWRIGRLFLILACLLPAGCGDEYIYGVVTGELRLLARAVPIEQGLEDPSLNEEQRAKLALVIRARDYAGSVIGLNVSRNYQTFANLGGEPLAWNLSAARKDAFEPHIWAIPFAGRLPYIGYFDKDQALAERDRLLAAGYDTMMYELDAYSTLGLLPDPVTSTLLRRDRTSLVDTIFHELSHSTIFSASSTTYDESLATFVGRTAAVEFLTVEYGPESTEVAEARASYADQDRHQGFLRTLIAELQDVYASELSYEEKLTRRSAVIAAAQQRYATEVLPLMQRPDLYQGFTTLPYNNAYLLSHVRYNQSQELFAAIYAKRGYDWHQTLLIFAAAAASPDPFEYLRLVQDDSLPS